VSKRSRRWWRKRRWSWKRRWWKRKSRWLNTGYRIQKIRKKYRIQEDYAKEHLDAQFKCAGTVS